MKKISLLTRRILWVTVTLMTTGQPIQAGILGDLPSKVKAMQQQVRGWTRDQFIARLDKAYNNFQKKMKTFQKNLESGAKQTSEKVSRAALLAVFIPLVLLFLSYGILRTEIYITQRKRATLNVERNLIKLADQLGEYIRRLETSTLRSEYTDVLVLLKERYSKSKKLLEQYKTKKFPKIGAGNWNTAYEPQLLFLKQIYQQLQIVNLVGKDARLQKILEYNFNLEQKINNINIHYGHVGLGGEPNFSIHVDSLKFGQLH